MTQPLTPGQQRTAKALAARKRNAETRTADRLRARGWVCVAPPDDAVLLPEVHQDAATRAVYVRLTDKAGFAVSRTAQPHPRVNLDFDEAGDLAGVEIL